MPKILIATISMAVLLISSALPGNAQCFTKEIINGKNMLRGTPDYIYVRTDTNYLGMTFALEKDGNSIYKLEIKSDATKDFAEPDSAVLQMENSSLISFALKPGITSISDGNLKSTKIQVIIPLHNLGVLQGRKVINVSAYRMGKKIDIPVYDELFLIQQFQCMKDVSKSGG